MSTGEEFPKTFDYKEAEPRLYSSWEMKGVFRGEPDPNKPAFCVVMPPPNVTGILHVGHVLDNVPQDVMTRWHRMRGFAAVWIPGTDHAGIATQNVVKRQLAKEGLTEKDLGREAFLERVWQWRDKHGGIIVEQLKRLGCSCDWQRERFTMDEGLSRAVLTAFVHLYQKGLIYRGKRMINWCATCRTALANDEVEHIEHNGHLWYLRYPLVGVDGAVESEAGVVVATTRPETVLGDTAVAVHPDDDRYRDLVGREVLLPLQDRRIPVIADKYVDPQFGTGVVKITPSHDSNDYEIGLRHKLDQNVVIGFDGCMTALAGERYAGLDRFEARKRVLADLEARGFLVETEKYQNSIGQCYRCNSVIEPLASDQWFVKMKPLTQKARQAVLDGRINIVPDSEKHDYFGWLDKIEDWCISRQLWWGHRIPIYYCDQCGAVMASADTPDQCEQCGARQLRQDEDVLDTWFSSQLWPFSILGWPDQTPELAYWYPNTWLMSGRDILFFWDCRMIIAGLELVGDVPFRTLALHGLVRDKQGRKLSKSLGNSPDPLALFDQYGTDAVRAAIVLNYPMGRQDTRLGEDAFKQGQGLVIKLWNASRLLIGFLDGEMIELSAKKAAEGPVVDRWIIGRLRRAVVEHDRYLNDNDFVHAFGVIYEFFWNEYCDWYLELIKPRLRSGGEDCRHTLETALYCEQQLLKLFHPYIPFVTEELWQIFARQGVRSSEESDEFIAVSAWPNPEGLPVDQEAERALTALVALVRSVRDVRHNLGLPPKLELEAKLHYFDTNDEALLSQYREHLMDLGVLRGLSTIEELPVGWVPASFGSGVIYLQLPNEVSADEMRTRLEQQISKLERGLVNTQGRLNNPEFCKNAPAKLVAEVQAKAAELQAGLEQLAEYQRLFGDKAIH